MSKKKKPYGIIYLVQNLQNKKIYIGKTTNEDPIKYIEDHFRDALSGKKPKKYFYNAIRKYGREMFTYRILGECKNSKQLNKAEIEAIWLYRSFGSDGENFDDIYGYNMTKGGDGGDVLQSKGKTYEEIYGENEANRLKIIRSNSLKGKKRTKETCEKLSKVNRGRKYSKKVCKAISKRISGEGNPFYGKKHKKESMERMVSTRRERNNYKQTEEQREKNKIKSYNRKVELSKHINNEFILRLFFDKLSNKEIINEYEKAFKIKLFKSILFFIYDKYKIPHSTGKKGKAGSLIRYNFIENNKLEDIINEN